MKVRVFSIFVFAKYYIYPYNLEKIENRLNLRGN